MLSGLQNHQIARYRIACKEADKLTSKEYLCSIRSLDSRIEQLQESLEGIRARASVQSPQ